MNNSPAHEVRVHRIAGLCFIPVAVLAAMILVSWWLDRWQLGTLGPHYVPMAPSSALAFILTAGAVWGLFGHPGSPIARRVGYVAASGVTLAGLLGIAQTWVPVQLPLDRWITVYTPSAEQIPVGQMSPLTGAGFLLTGAALLLEFPSSMRGQRMRQAGSVLALVVALFGLGIVQGYAFDAPPLYGSTTVPVAVLTALSFVMVGLGLVLGARTDIWPLNLFDRPQGPSASLGFGGGLVALALLLVVTIGTTGYFSFVRQRTDAHYSAEEMLKTVADLKVRQISAWYRERLADAQTICSTPMIATEVRKLLAPFPDTGARGRVLKWMGSVHAEYSYGAVGLYDSRGALRLAVGSGAGALKADGGDHVSRALRANGPLVEDLHAPESGEQVHMSILVPLRCDASADAIADGVVVLQINPKQFLFPLVQSWPTPSPSGETLLVRRDGNQVVFLNELRHRQQAAVTLRVPFAPESFPAVAAVEGAEKVLEGSDYRGIPVLAATRPVTGTPWFMVSKIDQEEVDGPLRQAASRTTATTVILMMSALLGTTLLWRQRHLVSARTELALAREREASDRKFRILFDQAPLGIALVDSINGKLYAVNPRFAEIAGRTVEEMAAIDWMSITHPDDIQEDLDQMSKLNAGQISGFQMNKRYRRPDGSYVWISMTIAPIASDPEGGRRHLCMIEDITDRRRLEDELRHSQKMESIGALAGGVAHDFNNILAASMMQLDLMQMVSNVDAEVRGGLNDLGDQLRRASALTRQLLMFSRRSVLSVRPLDVNDVVEALLKMLRRLIGEDIDLRYEGRAGLPHVEADTGMLEQVIVNLTVNARDAVAKGGRITISTSHIHLDVRSAGAHPGRRTGEFVCLSVADTGCGMDAATMERIFEPFFTTKEAGKGTGLGLATAHGIVAQHNGWMEVHSEAGLGSTFTVFLPAFTGSPVEAELALTSEPPKGRGETILLVEDEPEVRHVVARMLVALGYRVLEAGTGREAIRVWDAEGSHVDVVLTDMVMPEGMTGLELIERLRAGKPGLKAIISSGYSADLVQGATNGMAGVAYLPKPYERRVLARTVRDSLDAVPLP